MDANICITVNEEDLKNARDELIAIKMNTPTIERLIRDLIETYESEVKEIV
jgi:hypothetical protein